MSNKLKLSITLGLVATGLVAIFSFGYWLLASVKIANTPLAIKAKHYYYLELAPKFGQTYKRLPFSIIPMQKIDDKDGTVYAYIMLGRYEKMDFINQVLYLKTRSGQTYGFKFFLMPGSEFLFQEAENGIIRKTALPIDPSNPDKNPNPFTAGEVISVQWIDRRTLAEILQSAKTDPQMLINQNMRISDFQLINRVTR